MSTTVNNPQPYPGAESGDPSGPATTARDLALPLYGASFGQAITRYFKKYATFSGRASRSEYWWVMLFTFLLSLLPAIALSTGFGIGVGYAVANRENATYIDASGNLGTYGYGPGVLSSPPAAVLIGIGAVLLFVIFLGLLIPNLAVNWRRLHDGGHSGAFWFLSLIPAVGGWILLVFALLGPKPEGKRFDVEKLPAISSAE
jgi:uncharacterized membrane protein YhaH (DUF805 family)